MVRANPSCSSLRSPRRQLAAAQTMNFSEGAAMLGKSCAPDITANCRGVNIDSTRLKECLYRNQDVMSAACKTDYPRAFDAIQKRIAARATVGRECEYEVVKKCGGKGREVFKSLNCLLALPTVSARCTKSIADVGYRATDEVATKLSRAGNPAGAGYPRAARASRRAIEIAGQERAAAEKAAADRARTEQVAERQHRHPVRHRHADREAGILFRRSGSWPIRWSTPRCSTTRS